MADIEAIFLDVDGTLVSFEKHRVPESAVESLQCLYRKGIKIIIATGRTSSDLHELEGIPYDAVVAMNGADCVLRDGTVIARRTIDANDFLKVKELSDRYGFPMAIETDRGFWVNKMDPSVIRMANLVNHPVPPVADLEKEFAKDDCCQLCIFCDEATEEKIRPHIPGLNMSRWNSFFADVNTAGTDKAVGLRAFCTYYGFDISRTMAFGDGGNDIPMLRAAGIGVAMGGASEAVRASADYQTGTVDEDGLRNALVHFGLL